MDVLTAIAAVVLLAILAAGVRAIADSRWTAALFQSKLAWLRAFVDTLPTRAAASAS